VIAFVGTCPSQDQLQRHESVVKECIIADALIDQSKQRSPNFPCSGRVTAYPEITRKRSSVRIGDDPLAISIGTHLRVLACEVVD